MPVRCLPCAFVRWWPTPPRMFCAEPRTRWGRPPFTQEEPYARRVADLQVYLRQHHGERDLAALGQLVLPSDPA